MHAKKPPQPLKKTDEKAPPKRFEATLPLGKNPPAEAPKPELDLDIGDIQSRLPYGSEDIADK